MTCCFIICTRESWTHGRNLIRSSPTDDRAALHHLFTLISILLLQIAVEYDEEIKEWSEMIRLWVRGMTS